jgi:hypothetical protein
MKRGKQNRLDKARRKKRRRKEKRRAEIRKQESLDFRQHKGRSSQIARERALRAETSSGQTRTTRGSAPIPQS